jgi:predicted  nucleic acid-binding Zn-ribbon protein
MHADLERLIELQSLNDVVERAERAIAEIPARLDAVEAGVAQGAAAVAAAKTHQTNSQTERRTIEKDLAAVQGRLSKYKDQLMAVKTNKEYQAMQHEIATAQHDVSTLEDRLLQHMIEADELAAAKAAERELARVEQDASKARIALNEERNALQRDIEGATSARARVAAGVSAPAMALYEHIARARRGSAMSPARNGACTVCHVRLRPQVLNEVRRNDQLIQCESCQRILYFEAQPAAAMPPAPPAE